VFACGLLTFVVAESGLEITLASVLQKATKFERVNNIKSENKNHHETPLCCPFTSSKSCVCMHMRASILPPHTQARTRLRLLSCTQWTPKQKLTKQHENDTRIRVLSFAHERIKSNQVDPGTGIDAEACGGVLAARQEGVVAPLGGNSGALTVSRVHLPPRVHLYLQPED
jgi:hypothetical protein